MIIDYLIAFLVGLALGYAWQAAVAAQLRGQLASAMIVLISADRYMLQLSRALHDARDFVRLHLLDDTEQAQQANELLSAFPELATRTKLDEHERELNERLEAMKNGR